MTGKQHLRLYDTDISLLNHAVPNFLGETRNRWNLRLLDLIMQLHDCVPSEIAGKIAWHPTKSIRKQLAERKTQCKAAAIQFATLDRNQ